jgi:hypothetical protein
MRLVCKMKCRHERNGRAGSSRGIALIATLLLLSLMIALTLGMTIAVTSDTLITLYYRNFRTSFYAADSGTNVARQYMANQIVAAIPGTFSNATQPIPSGTQAMVQASLLGQYGSSATASNLLITSGAAAGSWTGSFYIASSPAPTLTLVSCTPQWTGTPTNTGPYSCTNVPTCASCVASAFTMNDFVYQYAYAFTSMGQSKANEQATVQDVGNINITVNVGVAPGTLSSFAAWGMFIDQSPICNGSMLVGGTISGPVFTNGAWNYGTTTVGYNYTDTVGSVSPNFGYQFNSQCDQKSSATDSNSGTTIAPKFSGSPQFKLGQNAVPLPANSYSQKEAVVDQTGAAGSISNAAMNASLKTYNGTAYPVGGTTNAGVYLPYTTATSAACPKPPCITGGGIYVEGNANTAVLTASSPTSGALNGHSLQIFTITQGSTTTTVTEDLTANTTTISSQIGSGSVTTLAIAGLPQDDVNGTPTPATMLYVDGNIGTSGNNGLSGPGQGLPAIQNNAQVTVTASGNVNVTGDLLYSTPPIVIPADTIAVPSTTNSEVFGIFTASGNVNLENQQNNNNIEIDASIATIAAGGSGALTNSGDAINTLTIVGGRIQNTIQDINTTTRNVWFDRRFAQGNFAPPWFPSTTVTPLTTDTNSGAITTFTRTSWLAPNQ